MKYLNKFDSFIIESNIVNSLPEPVNIDEMIEDSKAIEWWRKNRSHIKIYSFKFSTPVHGCSIGSDGIAINNAMHFEQDFKLFLMLHESKHCDQQLDGEFDEKYFQSLVEGKYDVFKEYYEESEKEANLFALDVLNELGYESFVRKRGTSLRQNENMASMVYKMVRNDLTKVNAPNFKEFLLKTIL